MISCNGLRLALFTDTFTPQMNGVARTLDRLVHAVNERDGEIRVFTVSDPDANDAPHVVRYASRSFPAYRELQLAWPSQGALLSALRQFRPTLIHAATEFGVGLAGLRAGKVLGVPFVSSYHTNFTQYARYYCLGVLAEPGWRYLRWFHNSGRRTWVPTNAIREQVMKQGFLNVGVWSRGVDTSVFNPSFRSTELRQSIGVKEGQLVIAYVGRLAAEKGIEVALDAIRLVNERRPDEVFFVCVGDGPYASELRKSAPRDAWFPGRLAGDDLSRAYASSDLLIFPSITDTFGNVQLEAMASGVAVLGADVPATREILGEERGFLAEPGNAESFARAIGEILDQRSLLERARQVSLEHANGSRWEDIWDRLISEYLGLHSLGHLSSNAVQ